MNTPLKRITLEHDGGPGGRPGLLIEVVWRPGYAAAALTDLDWAIREVRAEIVDGPTATTIKEEGLND